MNLVQNILIFIACSFFFQNSAPISRIGKIWSFIDPEIMGKIKTYDVKWTNEDVEIKKLKEFKFEKRVIASK